MNSHHLQNKIGKGILVFSLLFGIAMVSSMTAQAQYPGYPGGQDRQDRRDRNRDNRRDRDNRGYGRGGYNVYQIAQDQGYQAGVSTGASDAQRGQNYDPQRSHYYRNATYGYNSSYGNREAYKQAYRNGFLSGYREGFQRYGGNRRRGYGNRSRFPW
jgi:hypothetical protein